MGSDRRGTSTFLFVVLGIAAILGTYQGVAAQGSETPGLCLLTVEEVEEITGVDFLTADGTLTACTYASDPAVDLYALDLRLQAEADLSLVQLNHVREGEETEVGGLPAWSSADGLFVDVGEQVLAVQPVFFLSDATPDPVPVQQAVAELAVPRVGPALEALSGPGTTASLEARFPSEVAGAPVFPYVLPGDEFLQFVDLGTARITEVLATQGRTLADLLIGGASVGETTELTAIQLPGGDASILLSPVFERFAGAGVTPTPVDRAGKQVVATEALGQSVWFHVDGDVLWILTGTDEQQLAETLEALP